MLVRFVRRSPERELLGMAEMSAVPRVDECVTIDGEIGHVVHSVMWDIATGTVEVTLTVF